VVVDDAHEPDREEAEDPDEGEIHPKGSTACAP
jgi:hypothetical protein